MSCWGLWTANCVTFSLLQALVDLLLGPRASVLSGIQKNMALRLQTSMNHHWGSWGELQCASVGFCCMSRRCNSYCDNTAEVLTITVVHSFHVIGGTTLSAHLNTRCPIHMLGV